LFNQKGKILIEAIGKRHEKEIEHKNFVLKNYLNHKKKYEFFLYFESYKRTKAMY